MIITKLTNPIPFFNVEVTQISWEVSYPSLKMYYVMQDAEGSILNTGNWDVPEELISQWGPDSIIGNALVAAAPWIIATTTTTTTAIQTIETL